MRPRLCADRRPEERVRARSTEKDVSFWSTPNDQTATPPTAITTVVDLVGPGSRSRSAACTRTTAPSDMHPTSKGSCGPKRAMSIAMEAAVTTIRGTPMTSSQRRLETANPARPASDQQRAEQRQPDDQHRPAQQAPELRPDEARRGTECVPLQGAPHDEPGAVTLLLGIPEPQHLVELRRRAQDRIPVVDHRGELVAEPRRVGRERDDADDRHGDEEADPDAHRPVLPPLSGGGLAGTIHRSRPPRQALPSARTRCRLHSATVPPPVPAAVAGAEPWHSPSAAFVVVVLLLMLGAGRRIGDLSHRRDEALASRSDPVDVGGDAAGAFRRFRTTLRTGSASRWSSARASAGTRRASTGWSRSPSSTRRSLSRIRRRPTR